MADVTLDLSSFAISLDTGCLDDHRVESLPSYFLPWQRVAGNVTSLIETKMLRQEVDKLTVLDAGRLSGRGQLLLAHAQLSVMAGGYVWQEGDVGVAKVLPEALAVPFDVISRRLGIKPIVSHASLVLGNWAWKDGHGPRSLENIRLLVDPPGGQAGHWFILCTVQVELTFARAIQHFVDILEQLGRCELPIDQRANQIASHLKQISKVVCNMRTDVARLHEKLTAEAFYQEVRPFLAGWGGDNNVLPQGLVYQGVSDTPIQVKGGSAAQSPSLQTLDALTGVKHSGERNEFLVEMRDYMLPEHAKFIEYLEKSPIQLRDFVTTNPLPALVSAYDELLQAIITFRRYHVAIVTKYVIQASKKVSANKYESLETQGTGGSDLLPFLSAICRDTTVAMETRHNENNREDIGHQNSKNNGDVNGYNAGNNNNNNNNDNDSNNKNPNNSTSTRKNHNKEDIHSSSNSSSSSRTRRADAPVDRGSKWKTSMLLPLACAVVVVVGVATARMRW